MSMGKVHGQPNGLFIGLWVRCQLRKPTKDALTGKRLPKGSRAYRPLTNTKLRSQRVAEADMLASPWFDAWADE